MANDFYGRLSDLNELILEGNGDIEAEDWPYSVSLRDYSSAIECFFRTHE